MCHTTPILAVISALTEATLYMADITSVRSYRSFTTLQLTYPFFLFF